MKKFIVSLVLILMVSFVPLCFCACGERFSGARLEFSTEYDTLKLFINGDESDSKNLSVTFVGNNDVSPVVEIDLSDSSLAVIENVKRDGETTQFTITPQNAGKGSVIARLVENGEICKKLDFEVIVNPTGFVETEKMSYVIYDSAQTDFSKKISELVPFSVYPANSNGGKVDYYIDNVKKDEISNGDLAGKTEITIKASLSKSNYNYELEQTEYVALTEKNFTVKVIEKPTVYVEYLKGGEVSDQFDSQSTLQPNNISKKYNSFDVKIDVSSSYNITAVKFEENTYVSVDLISKEEQKNVATNKLEKTTLKYKVTALRTTTDKLELNVSKLVIDNAYEIDVNVASIEFYIQNKPSNVAINGVTLEKPTDSNFNNGTIAVNTFVKVAENYVGGKFNLKIYPLDSASQYVEKVYAYIPDGFELVLASKTSKAKLKLLGKVTLDGANYNKFQVNGCENYYIEANDTTLSEEYYNFYLLATDGDVTSYDRDFLIQSNSLSGYSYIFSGKGRIELLRGPESVSDKEIYFAFSKDGKEATYDLDLELEAGEKAGEMSFNYVQNIVVASQDLAKTDIIHLTAEKSCKNAKIGVTLGNGVTFNIVCNVICEVDEDQININKIEHNSILSYSFDDATGIVMYASPISYNDPLYINLSYYPENADIKYEINNSWTGSSCGTVDSCGIYSKSYGKSTSKLQIDYECIENGSIVTKTKEINLVVDIVELAQSFEVDESDVEIYPYFDLGYFNIDKTSHIINFIQNIDSSTLLLNKMLTSGVWKTDRPNSCDAYMLCPDYEDYVWLECNVSGNQCFNYDITNRKISVNENNPNPYGSGKIYFTYHEFGNVISSTCNVVVAKKEKATGVFVSNISSDYIYSNYERLTPNMTYKTLSLNAVNSFSLTVSVDVSPSNVDNKNVRYSMYDKNFQSVLKANELSENGNVVVSEEGWLVLTPEDSIQSDDQIYNSYSVFIKIVKEDGSENNPYVIRTSSDFYNFMTADTENNYYVIENNIDISVYAENMPFTFKGKSLKGNDGVVVRGINLYCEDDGKAHNALFREILSSSTISNITFEGKFGDFSKNTNPIGIGIITLQNKGKIENCTVNIGYSNCVGNDTKIEKLGVICALNLGTISSCHVFEKNQASTLNTKDIDYVGGVCAENQGYVIGRTYDYFPDNSGIYVIKVYTLSNTGYSFLIDETANQIQWNGNNTSETDDLFVTYTIKDDTCTNYFRVKKDGNDLFKIQKGRYGVYEVYETLTTESIVNSMDKSKFTCSLTINCTNESYAGLICAKNTKEIQNCDIEGKIISTAKEGNSSEQSCIGGICGYNEYVIENCLSLATIKETKNSEYVYVGGLVGCSNKDTAAGAAVVSDITTKNCFLVAIDDHETEQDSTRKVETGADVVAGLLVGYLKEGSCETCFFVNYLINAISPIKKGTVESINQGKHLIGRTPTNIQQNSRVYYFSKTEKYYKSITKAPAGGNATVANGSMSDCKIGDNSGTIIKNAKNSDYVFDLKTPTSSSIKYSSDYMFDSRLDTLAKCEKSKLVKDESSKYIAFSSIFTGVGGMNVTSLTPGVAYFSNGKIYVESFGVAKFNLSSFFNKEINNLLVYIYFYEDVEELSLEVLIGNNYYEIGNKILTLYKGEKITFYPTVKGGTDYQIYAYSMCEVEGSLVTTDTYYVKLDNGSYIELKNLDGALFNKIKSLLYTVNGTNYVSANSFVSSTNYYVKTANGKYAEYSKTTTKSNGVIYYSKSEKITGENLNGIYVVYADDKFDQCDTFFDISLSCEIGGTKYTSIIQLPDGSDYYYTKIKCVNGTKKVITDFDEISIETGSDVKVALKIQTDDTNDISFKLNEITKTKSDLNYPASATTTDGYACCNIIIKSGDLAYSDASDNVYHLYIYNTVGTLLKTVKINVLPKQTNSIVTTFYSTEDDFKKSIDSCSDYSSNMIYTGSSKPFGVLKIYAYPNPAGSTFTVFNSANNNAKCVFVALKKNGTNYVENTEISGEQIVLSDTEKIGDYYYVRTSLENVTYLADNTIETLCIKCNQNNKVFSFDLYTKNVNDVLVGLDGRDEFDKDVTENVAVNYMYKLKWGVDGYVVDKSKVDVQSQFVIIGDKNKDYVKISASNAELSYVSGDVYVKATTVGLTTKVTIKAYKEGKGENYASQATANLNVGKYYFKKLILDGTTQDGEFSYMSIPFLATKKIKVAIINGESFEYDESNEQIYQQLVEDVNLINSKLEIIKSTFFYLSGKENFDDLYSLSGCDITTKKVYNGYADEKRYITVSIGFGYKDGTIDFGTVLNRYFTKLKIYSFQVTSEDEYLMIESYDDLLLMQAGNNYRLVNNISLDESFTPIKTAINKFDGNGYSFILPSSLTANEDKWAIFDNENKDFMLTNLNVMLNESGTTITAKQESLDMAIFIYNNYGVIYNCSFTNNSLNSSASLSINTSTDSEQNNKIEFASICYTNYGYVVHCSVESIATIKVLGSFAGLVFENKKILSSSYMRNCKVISSGTNKDYVAGCVAKNTENGSISSCYVFGASDTSPFCNLDSATISSFGSISGFVYENSGEITDSFANIKMFDASDASGFVYRNNDTGKIINCYASCTLKSTDISYQPFVALSDNTILNYGEIKNCYYVKKDSDTYTVTSAEGVKELSTNDAKNKEKFTDFLFNETTSNIIDCIWEIEDSQFPTLVSPNIDLKSQYVGEKTNDPNTNKTTIVWTQSSSGASVGTRENPYVVYSAEKFEEMLLEQKGKNEICVYLTIVKDLDFSDLKTLVVLSNMTFVGVIDGNGCALQNISISGSNAVENAGLFGQIGSSTSFGIVKNLKIEANSVAFANSKNVGILAGSAINAYILNVSASCENVVKGEIAVGGLIGRALKTKFSNVQANVSVNATLASQSGTDGVDSGYAINTDAEIIKDIDNVSKAGGIVGYMYNGSVITNSFVSGGTSKNPNYVIAQIAGGICGMLRSSGINSDNTKISYSDVEGYINVKSLYISGGIVGYLNCTTSYDSILNCYVNPSNKDSISFDSENSIVAPIFVGGIVGYIKNGSIKNEKSETNCSVESAESRYVGGVAGLIESGSIDGFSVNGSVNGGMFSGGIVGKIQAGGTVEITNCQVNGNIISSLMSGVSGGIVAEIENVNNYRVEIKENQIANNKVITIQSDLIAGGICGNAITSKSSSLTKISKNKVGKNEENERNDNYVYIKVTSLTTSSAGKAVGCVEGTFASLSSSDDYNSYGNKIQITAKTVEKELSTFTVSFCYEGDIKTGVSLVKRINNVETERKTSPNDKILILCGTDTNNLSFKITTDSGYNISSIKMNNKSQSVGENVTEWETTTSFSDNVSDIIFTVKLVENNA